VNPAKELTVGDKVTVITTLADPPHLACHPHTVIAEVAEQPGGVPAYLVEHTDTYWPQRFGPFTSSQLKPGW